MQSAGGFDSNKSAGAAGAPQERQNFFPGASGFPQFEQMVSMRAPHSSQKREALSRSARHLGQFTWNPVVEFWVHWWMAKSHLVGS